MASGIGKAQIFNMALSNIGSTAVVEDPDERTPYARECRVWYESSRLLTLEAHNWGFARRSRALAAHEVEAPEVRWAYRYQYPEDCLVPRLIENPAGDDAIPVAFAIEQADDVSKCVLTNQESAVLIYTRDTSLVDLFTNHYIDMLATRLAVKICIKLNGKVSRRDRLVNEWNQLLVQAPAMDSISEIPKEPPISPWHQARNS